MALTGELLTFMNDFADVSNELDASVFVLNAKKSILEDLKSFELSQEEKAKLYSNFIQQISMGLIAQAVDIVKTAPASKYAEEKAKYDRFAAEASLRKQYGFVIGTDNKLENKEDGLIDEQIKGFGYDGMYKIANIISSENQMLVQNDQAVHDWQVDIWKMAVEQLSRGKIDIETVGTGTTRATTVSWNGVATESDGI